MSNSRSTLGITSAPPAPNTPTNTSRDFGKILENVYKPGFVDQDTLENTKMAVDRELGEISKAFFQTTERTTDTIKRVDLLVIEDENLSARIEEVDFVSKQEDIALANRITTVEAEYKAADVEINASITDESTARADADSALATQITTVESQLGDDIAQVQTYAETNIDRIDGDINSIESKWGVRVNVNGKVTGIALNNNGSQSSFSVQADQFIINNGTTDSGAPFEVLGGVTKIKNASVGTIQSDNWNGSSVGWQILKNGNATFNNVTVRGHVEASSGSFTGAITATSGSFTGTVNADSGEFNNVVIQDSCTILGEVSAAQINGDIYQFSRIAPPQAGGGSGNDYKDVDVVVYRVNVSPEDYSRTIYVPLATIGSITILENGATVRLYQRSSVGGSVLLATANGNLGDVVFSTRWPDFLITIPPNASYGEIYFRSDRRMSWNRNNPAGTIDTDSVSVYKTGSGISIT